jgi:hypothetical protein
MQANKTVQIPQNTDLNRGNNPKSDLGGILEEIKIRPEEKGKHPEPVIQFELADEVANFGSLGDFSVIIGKAKSRKTFFLSLLVAAYLKPDHGIDCIKSFPHRKKRKVVYFDTEQGRADVIKVKDRIIKLAGDCNQNDLEIYPLRKFSTSTRLDLIEERLKDCSDVGLVIIDGARDLVSSINNEEQATDIASRFLRWTEEKQVHLITVLHQNKGDNNARGHLGTELINKAQTVVSVSKDPHNKNISIIESEYCRGQDIPTVAFEIGEDYLPQLILGYKKTEKTKSNIDLESLSEIAKYQFLNELLTTAENAEGLGYQDLGEKIQVLFHKKNNSKVGMNKVKDFIKYCREKGYILQEKKSAPYMLGAFNVEN